MTTTYKSFWVAGVDGCPAGWIAVLRDIRGNEPPHKQVVASFDEIAELPEQPAIIAVDIPIGLPDTIGSGGRGCDVAARKVLGARQSSVFSVPARSAVMEDDYWAACDLALQTSEPPRKVSKQCFNIFPKIREVDAWIMMNGNDRVYECHPEVAFWALNGKVPLTEPKKAKSSPYEPGLRLRKELLRQAGFNEALFVQEPFKRKDVAPDDVLDACAASWTAERIAHGSAICFPEKPQTDGHGLSMAIWA